MPRPSQPLMIDDFALTYLCVSLSCQWFHWKRYLNQYLSQHLAMPMS